MAKKTAANTPTHSASAAARGAPLTPSLIPAGPASYGEVGIATAFGAAAGFASKKIAKSAAFAIGLGFMGLQALAHADIIKINWPKVESMFVGAVDQDGDGKLTGKDVQVGAARLVHNLTTDIPSSSGFAVAFWVGYRYG